MPLGIALGLLLGKQLGIFGIIWLSVKAGIAKLPNNVSWVQIYGLSVLCGIGFTMSLFIGSLAFNQTSAQMVFDERVGIIIGSLLSGILGALILIKTLPKTGQPDGESSAP
jgi:NhaA family Na+:H+ antiporter